MWVHKPCPVLQQQERPMFFTDFEYKQKAIMYSFNLNQTVDLPLQPPRIKLVFHHSWNPKSHTQSSI